MKPKQVKKESLVDIAMGKMKHLMTAAFVMLSGLVASPFLWMWFGWSCAWRAAASGIVGFFFFFALYLYIRKQAEDYVSSLNQNGKNKKS